MDALASGSGGAPALTVDGARTYTVRATPSPAYWFKDPSAVLNFTWDWAAWLGSGEAIAAAQVTGTGVTIDSAVFTGTTVTARISGGAPGVSRAACHITTLLGQADDRTIYLTVREG